MEIICYSQNIGNSNTPAKRTLLIDLTKLGQSFFIGSILSASAISNFAKLGTDLARPAVKIIQAPLTSSLKKQCTIIYHLAFIGSQILSSPLGFCFMTVALINAWYVTCYFFENQPMHALLNLNKGSLTLYLFKNRLILWGFFKALLLCIKWYS